MNKNFQRSFGKFNDSVSKEPELIPGILGMDSTAQTVKVPNRDGFVYVRLRNNSSELIQAFNNKISPVYDLPVLVKRDGNRYAIVGQDSNRYISWGSNSSYLPIHGDSHSFNPAKPGTDIVWVYSRQFEPMLVSPSYPVGPSVTINPYTLKDLNGNFKTVGGTGTASLIGYNPGGTDALMLLIYMDALSGNPGLLVGSTFPATLTGTNDVIPYIPASNNPNHLPAAAVRLVAGTTIINWDNIYEARQFMPAVPSGTQGPQGIPGPMGTGAVGPQGPAGAGNPGVMAWNQGTPVGTGTIFNFVGSNVDASISGSVVRVFVTGSSGGGGGRTLLGEMTPSGTANAQWTGILGTYKKLLLEFAIRSTDAAAYVSAILSFNADTTDANYRSNSLFSYAGGSVVSAGAADRNILLTSVPGGASAVGEFGIGAIEIPQYANVNFNKSAFGHATVNLPASNYLMNVMVALAWANTAAITQIDLDLSAGNFEVGSVLRLYGEN